MYYNNTQAIGGYMIIESLRSRDQERRALINIFLLVAV